MKNEEFYGMNIYFAYNIETGVIVSSYLGYYDGDWTNIPDNCAVIGPFKYETVPEIMILAGEDTELYLIFDGEVVDNPQRDEILAAREEAESNRPLTDAEKIQRLQSENLVLKSSNKALDDMVSGLIDLLIMQGVI